jgi:hypothetical protein
VRLRWPNVCDLPVEVVGVPLHAVAVPVGLRAPEPLQPDDVGMASGVGEERDAVAAHEHRPRRASVI